MENLAAPDTPPPPTSPDAKNFTVNLKRGEMGFGFRIIGGQEENTQVSEIYNYSLHNVICKPFSSDGLLEKGRTYFKLEWETLANSSYFRSSNTEKYKIVIFSANFSGYTNSSFQLFVLTSNLWVCVD